MFVSRKDKFSILAKIAFEKNFSLFKLFFAHYVILCLIKVYCTLYELTIFPRCRPSHSVLLLTVASTKSEGTRAGQKSSRWVYLRDKSLPFVRRKCLGFRRHLRAVYPARVSCTSLARDSRESTVDNTLFPAEKRAKPAKPAQGDSSCLGQSQISKRRCWSEFPASFLVTYSGL